jgi:Zn finger protein HypA/HybF involved in hydrogenase expression
MVHPIFYRCPECKYEEVSCRSNLICPVCKKRMIPEFYVTAGDFKKITKKPSPN